jgi:hypothetical protein
MTDAPDYNAEAIDFIFEEVKAAPTRALQAAVSMERRGTQAFSAGTVLIGLGGFSNVGHASHATLALLSVSALFYAVTIVCAICLLLPSQVLHLPTATEMWECRHYDARATKASIIQAIKRDEVGNADMVASKRRWATRAVVLMALEGAAMAAALILAHVTSA